MKDIKEDEHTSATSVSQADDAHNNSQSEQQSNKQSNDVLFETLSIRNNLQIGLVTLNRPKSLNALSTTMCQLISVKLTEWAKIDALVSVVIRGAGERAMCAGGDVRMLYQAKQDLESSGIVLDTDIKNDLKTGTDINTHIKTDTVPEEAIAFFESEYYLDTQMHEYLKPIIIWGSGIVMGGGMGLLSSSSHRIVTETTYAAMPEVSIGLFPDATGSWFLQRYPAKAGLFMGLTGAAANANDALLCNLADYKANSNDFDALIESLCQADWSEALSIKDNKSYCRELTNIASKTLEAFSEKSATNTQFAPSNIVKHWQSIQALMNCGGLAQIDAILQSDANLKAFDEAFANDAWVQAAVTNYRNGCPVTKAITYEMFHRAQNLSLSEVMALETNVALHCVVYPDFSEGVRALLIDKDKNPQWSCSLAQCLDAEGRAYINGHFEKIV